MSTVMHSSDRKRDHEEKVIKPFDYSLQKSVDNTIKYILNT